jgi:hypothetical protein
MSPEIPVELEMSVEQLQVRNQEEANFAGNLLREIATVEKRIEEAFEVPVSLAHKTHKSLTALRGKFLAPLADMKGKVRQLILGWQAVEEENRRAEQRRVEEEARKAREAEEAGIAAERRELEAEQKRLLDAARAAQESGDLEAAADAAQLAQEAASASADLTAEAQVVQFAPPPVAALPVVPKIAGVSTAKRWKFEVSSLMELVQAVAAGKAPISYLCADEKAIRGVVNSLKENTAIPGVRVWPENSLSARG